MLNLLPLEKTGEKTGVCGALLPPRRRDVADYLRERFADASGGFRFTCDQDFLLVRPLE